ncbi:hypothetical protein SFR_1665 [Streptomyces sp. FR-008]|nr:hypothetical protein SFR_1665 [Streptomyces sp. FR-008]
MTVNTITARIDGAPAVQARPYGGAADSAEPGGRGDQPGRGSLARRRVLGNHQVMAVPRAGHAA